MPQPQNLSQVTPNQKDRNSQRMAAPNKSQRSQEGQDTLLATSTKEVARQAFFMKRAVDKNELKTVLKHAAVMLNELRTGLLLPKSYYDLFMRVCDELHVLEMYFADVVANGKSVVELYQQVQHCGNVLPRLYLLSTVGSVYLKTKEAPAKDILKDLVEMTKGVQHPMRGLFLRSFLSTQTKDKLPDTNSEYEGEGGNVTDAIDFVLQNFCEMNRLWVRMQRQGSSKTKRRLRREKERQQLRILVGTNLVRLSQLEGVDLGCYQETVLPRVLEEVANCKDHIAQQYLMDCVIQVFPDEFHLKTLEPFLEACTKLDEKVEVKSILITLMDRIVNWNNTDNNTIPKEVDAFKLLNENVAQVIQAKSAMEVNDILELQCALQSFASSCYADTCKQYVDHILGFSAQVLERVGGSTDKGGANLPEESVRLVVQLLTTPQQVLGLEVLDLEHYAKLLEQLSFVPRKKVAMKLLRSIVDKNSTLNTPSMVESLFKFVAPLMKDQADTIPYEDLVESDREQFAVEQRLVGRLISLIRHDEDGQLFQIYTVARKHFGKGGMNRIRYTLVPLVFGYIGLAARLKKSCAPPAPKTESSNPEDEEFLEADKEKKEEQGSSSKVSTKKATKAAKKVFQFIHEILTVLAGVDEYQNIALYMFLEAAKACDNFNFESIAYAFISKAFALYEDTANSKQRVRALQQVIGTLHGCVNFSEENYDTLIKNTSKYAAKLLKKEDQCSLVCQCTHLFWTGNGPNGEPPRNGQDDMVLQCLKRSLKIAEAVLDTVTNAKLFVDVLNEYLYFYAQECPKIETKYLTGLVALCNQNISELDQDKEGTAAVVLHFKNTVKFIASKAKSGDKRYSAIDLP